MTKLILALLLITGCQTMPLVGYRQIPGPSGEKIFEAQCNGQQNSIGDCMKLAAEVCGKQPYEVIGQDSQATTVPLAGNMGGVAIMARSLLFRCKA
jgi:hypothetical protein